MPTPFNTGKVETYRDCEQATRVAHGSARSRSFRVAQTVFGVGMTVEEPNDVSMRMREWLASAAHAARRQLGVDIRKLTLHASVRTHTLPTCRR